VISTDASSVIRPPTTSAVESVYRRGMTKTPPRLSDLPLDDLRRILRDTELAVGEDSSSAMVIRRVLAERERAARTSDDPEREDGNG